MIFLVPETLKLPFSREDLTNLQVLFEYLRDLTAQLIRMYDDIGTAFRNVNEKLDIIMDVDNDFFKPPRESASAQPTPSVGELKVWRDPDDNKTYLIYNDTDEGVRKVELT